MLPLPIHLAQTQVRHKARKVAQRHRFAKQVYGPECEAAISTALSKRRTMGDPRGNLTDASLHEAGDTRVFYHYL